MKTSVQVENPNILKGDMDANKPKSMKIFYNRKDYNSGERQRHYFVNKGQSSQGYGFSSSHVQIWELDHKEG